jgi:hypothetical protein
MQRVTPSASFQYEGHGVNTERVLRVGIAGFGIVGRRRKAVIDARPDMKVVAVCDQIFKEDSMADGLRHYPNHQSLLMEDLMFSLFA